MNEFTKEELEDLDYICGLHIMNLGCDDSPCDYIDLQNKIQRIIETYNTPKAIRERTSQHGGNNG